MCEENTVSPILLETPSLGKCRLTGAQRVPLFRIRSSYLRKELRGRKYRNGEPRRENQLHTRKDTNRRKPFQKLLLSVRQRKKGIVILLQQAKGSHWKRFRKPYRKTRILPRPDTRSWISALLRADRNLARSKFRRRPNRGFRSLKRRPWQSPSILRNRLSRGLRNTLIAKGRRAWGPKAGKSFRLPNPNGKSTAEFHPKERSKTLRVRPKGSKAEPPGPKAKAGPSRTVKTGLRHTRTTNVRKNR